MNFKEFYNERVVEENIPHQIKFNYYDFINYLTYKKKWHPIGVGANATVFDKSGKNYVLKLYRNDKCYDIFLDFVEKNQNNPHLVKIQRRIVSGDSGLVAIEKLQKIDYSSWRDSLVSSLGYYLGNYDVRDSSFNEVLEGVKQNIISYYQNEINDDTIYNVNAPGIDPLEKMKRLKSAQEYKKSYFSSLKRLDYFIESYLPALKTIYDLKTYLVKNGGRDCYMDTHLGNFMIRPSTGELVITDPVIKS